MSRQKSTMSLSLSCGYCFSFFLVLAAVLILGYNQRGHFNSFTEDTFKDLLHKHEASNLELNPEGEISVDAIVSNTKIELATSGEKTTIDYTLDQINEKCSINHPLTGKPVVSRYGLDCKDRTQRFPSIEQRLKVYLSSWYLPPCSKNDASAIKFSDPYVNTTKTYKGKTIETNFIDIYNQEDPSIIWSISNNVIADTMFFLDEHNVLAFQTSNSSYMRNYVNDVMNSIVPAMTRVNWNYHMRKFPSLVLQFGDISYSKNDNRHNVNIPRIQKFRHTIAPTELDGVIGIVHPKNPPKCIKHARTVPNTTKMPLALPAIIWKLNSERHYGHIWEIDELDKIPYHEKKSMALYRGGMTGSTHWDKKAKDEDNCSNNPRCSLVMQYFYSPLVDAKITEPFLAEHPTILEVKNKKWKRHWAADKQNETSIDYRSEERMTIEDMLSYKIIIILEGNDVSSGLKWALYSHCVVLMPYPTLETSWAMEELLEPYVHFVPVQHDLSDLHDAIEWILDHEDDARTIALRGRLWIQDLVFHSEIQQEDEIIQNQILTRYRDTFFKNE